MEHQETHTKCESCGRLLEGKLVVLPTNPYCTQCTDEDGILLPFEEVMQHYIDYLRDTEQMNIEEALIQARLTLVNQPAWSEPERADRDMYIGG